MGLFFVWRMDYIDLMQRRFQFYTLTAIGKITAVNDQPAWIVIQTEDGKVRSMKKIYGTWPRQLKTAQKLMENETQMTTRPWEY